MNFINHTIFPALNYDSDNQQHDTFHIVAWRITYDIRINNRDGQSQLVISPEQSLLNYTDVSYNEMVDTSIEYESDLAPYKPKTDIVINATAFVPENNPVPVFDVGIQIGKYQKVLRIFGPPLLGKRGWRVVSHGIWTDQLSWYPLWTCLRRYIQRRWYGFYLSGKSGWHGLVSGGISGSVW